MSSVFLLESYVNVLSLTEKTNICVVDSNATNYHSTIDICILSKP